MALTRRYEQSAVARIQRDKQFARALYAEALNALLEGETGEGLSMLRDLVHAEISFKELSRQTGMGEKALHRMLSRRGNPTTRSLFAVTKAICESLSFKPRMGGGGELVKAIREAGHTPVQRNTFYEPIKVWDSSPTASEAEPPTGKSKVLEDNLATV